MDWTEMFANAVNKAVDYTYGQGASQITTPIQSPDQNQSQGQRWGQSQSQSQPFTTIRVPQSQRAASNANGAWNAFKIGFNTGMNQTAYQQNLYTPTIKNSTPATTREALGYIAKTNESNPTEAASMLESFRQAQNDVTSPYYNPYSKPTNRAISSLADLGLDTSAINDDWFNQNAWLKDYYNVGGTTNNPTSPGKKATKEQEAAYQYYQVLKSEETTKKAESEWAALQEELSYWASRTDRNYTDEEIINKIDWSKYKTLADMDENASKGTPTELNRGISYSKDAMYGVIWAARNDGGTGDLETDMAYSALGYGKQWQQDSTISAKLDIANKDTYSPYSVGSTLEDEGLYFGVPSFDQEWLDNHRYYLAGNDETAKRLYSNVVEAEQRTQELEAELKALHDDIDNKLKYVSDPETIIDAIRNNSDGAYDELFALDKTLESGRLKGTTRAVDYRWVDIEKEIRDRCEAKRNRPNSATVVSNITTGTANPQGESVKAYVSQAFQRFLNPTAQTEPAVTITPATAQPVTQEPEDQESSDSMAQALQNIFNPATQTAEPSVEPDAATAQPVTQAPGATTAQPVTQAPGAVTAQPVTQAPGATTTQPVTQEPEPVMSQTQAALEAQTVNNLTQVEPTVQTKGTDAEKTAAMTGKTGAFDFYADKMLGAVQDAAHNTSEGLKTDARQKAVQNYLAPSRVTYNYNKHQKRLAQIGEERDRFDAEIASLGDKIAQIQVLADSDDVTPEVYQSIRSIRSRNDGSDDYLMEALSYNTSDQEALEVLYNRITGNILNMEMTPDYGAELERAQGWAELLVSDKELPEIMSEEDTERYSLLTKRKEELSAQYDEERDLLDSMQEDYDKATKEKDALMFSYTLSQAMSGLISGEKPDFSTIYLLDYALEVGQEYEATEWSAYNAFDAAVQKGDMTQEDAAVQAGGIAANCMQEAQYLSGVLTQLDALGVQLEGDERNNIQRHIDHLNRQAKEAAYNLIDTSDDFDEYVAKGRELALQGINPDDEAFKYLENADNLANFNAIAYSIVAGADNPFLLPEDTSLGLRSKKPEIEVMSEEEKNRYLYLLAKDAEEGTDTASAYFDMLSDPDYGTLTARAFNQEQENITEWTGTNFWTAMAGTGLSFVSNVVGGPQALLYMLQQKISGKEVSPYNRAFSNQATTSSAREGAKKYAVGVAGGEKTLAGKLVGMVYEGITSSVDSMINSALYGPLVDGVGDVFKGTKLYDKMSKLATSVAGKLEGNAAGRIVVGAGKFTIKATGDIAHASSMGLNAASSAYREAILSDATEDQMNQMFIATFLGETFSEAITFKNLKASFTAGAEGEAAKSFFKGLIGDALEEAFGEGANEWFGGEAEKLIMGEMSTYDKKIDEYIANGYPPSVARQLVDKETAKNIMYAAAVGAMSSGVGNVTSYAAGSIAEHVENNRNTQDITEPSESSLLEESGNYQQYVDEFEDAGYPHRIAEQKAEAKVRENALRRTIQEAQQASAEQSTTSEPVTESTTSEPVTESTTSESVTEEANSGGEVSPEVAAQDAEAVARMEAQEAEKTSKLGSLAEDLELLGKADDADETAAAVATAAVLRTGDKHLDKAAGQNIVGQFAEGDAKLAAQTMSTVLALGGADNAEATKTAVAQAAMTKGEGRKALQSVFDKARNGETITDADVKAISTGIEADSAKSEFQKALAEGIKESRIANRTLEILAAGDGKGKIQAAQNTVNKAQSNLNNAQQGLDNANAELESVAGNVQSAEQEYDPANPETAAPLQQTTNQLLGADAVVTEYEQSVQNAQSQLEDNQKALEQTQDEVMTQAREQAVAEVEAEIAQEQADAEAQVQVQAQQKFQQALEQHPTGKAFSKPLEVPIASRRGAGKLNLTGIYAVFSGGDQDTVVYSTDDGYVLDSWLDFADTNWSQEDFTAFDQVKDNWKKSYTPAEPYRWLEHSLEGVRDDGEVVDIIGWAGYTDDGMPVVMDSKGRLHGFMDLTIAEDSITGEDGSDIIFDTAEEKFGGAEAMPEIDQSQLYKGEEAPENTPDNQPEDELDISEEEYDELQAPYQIGAEEATNENVTEPAAEEPTIPVPVNNYPTKSAFQHPLAVKNATTGEDVTLLGAVGMNQDGPVLLGDDGTLYNAGQLDFVNEDNEQLLTFGIDKVAEDSQILATPPKAVTARISGGHDAQIVGMTRGQNSEGGNEIYFVDSEGNTYTPSELSIKYDPRYDESDPHFEAWALATYENAMLQASQSSVDSKYFKDNRDFLEKNLSPEARSIYRQMQPGEYDTYAHIDPNTAYATEPRALVKTKNGKNYLEFPNAFDLGGGKVDGLAVNEDGSIGLRNARSGYGATYDYHSFDNYSPEFAKWVVENADILADPYLMDGKNTTPEAVQEIVDYFQTFAPEETVTEETVTPETVTDETVTPEAATDENVTPEADTGEAVTPEAATGETVTPETTTEEAVTPEAATEETVTPEAATEETVTPQPGVKPKENNQYLSTSAEVGAEFNAGEIPIVNNGTGEVKNMVGLLGFNTSGDPIGLMQDGSMIDLSDTRYSVDTNNTDTDISSADLSAVWDALEHKDSIHTPLKSTAATTVNGDHLTLVGLTVDSTHTPAFINVDGTLYDIMDIATVSDDQWGAWASLEMQNWGVSSHEIDPFKSNLGPDAAAIMSNATANDPMSVYEPTGTQSNAGQTTTVQPGEAQTAAQTANTQASESQDQYSGEKINPETGEPLQSWQDPKFHGKVKKTKKKVNPQTKAFKKWFETNMSPDARPYLTNPDGTPRLFFRGYGDFGKTLYVEHQSKPVDTSEGLKYVNFYMSTISTAASYAGTSKISALRYANNWETAKAAMQDLGYDLIESPKPGDPSKMGYQVTRNGVPATGNHGESTWFGEHDLTRFRNTYGGKLDSKGIHAGYITMSKPVIIECNGANYSSVTATATAPDGEQYHGTQKTRSWAKWAFQHGADGVIFVDVMDNASGGGEVGTEVVTSQSSMFKSIYNKGSYSPDSANIMEYKGIDGKPASPQMQAAIEGLTLGKNLEDMTLEERKAVVANLKSLPEVQALMASKSDKAETLPYAVTGAIKSYDGSEASVEKLKAAGVPENTIELLKSGKASYVEAVESLFSPEDVEEQHRVRDKMAYEEGSTVFDENGKAQHTGTVEQGKRVDFVLGLPASGKSTLAEALSAQFHSRFCDNDDAKRFHRDYADGANSSPLHNESRFITAQAMQLMIDNGDNVVMPVVGHSFNSVLKQLKAFKDAGYEVHMHDVELPWNKAIARGLNRTVEDKRLLDFDYLLGTDSTELTPQKIRDTFNKFKEEGYLDGYATWDNDVERGKPPVAVNSSDAAETQITTGAFGTDPVRAELGGRGADDLTGGVEEASGLSAVAEGTGDGALQVTGNNSGELAPALGRVDGRGDNIPAGSGTGQETAGRGEESRSKHIRPDLGRVSERLLSTSTRSYLANKGVTDLNLQQADYNAFSTALENGRNSSDHGLFVDGQSVEALQHAGAITLLSPDGLAGVSIGTEGSEKGNIFGVFKHKESPAKHASAELLIQAIAQGGNKLDCYDGGLRRMYSQVGMIPVARVPFNEEIIRKYNPDWNFERDGRPDVVVWMYNGDSAETVAQTYGVPESEGGYHIYTEEDIARLPAFDDITEDVVKEDGTTETVVKESGYERAMAYRDQLIAHREAFEAIDSNIQALSVDNTTPSTPTEQQAQRTKKKLESPQRIAQNLVKALGFGNYMGTNKMGNMSQATRGYYDRHGKYLAVRNAEFGNYNVTMHEIGHGVADMLGITGTDDMVSNLVAVAPDFAAGYDQSQLKDESMAEFMWRYMESEDRARAFAGDTFYDDFEIKLKSYPEMYKAVKEARSQLQQWISASTDEQIRSVIRYDRDGDRTTMREHLKNFIFGMVDKSAAAEDVDRMTRELQGTKNLRVSDSVRSMALLSNHSQKMAINILTDSLTDANGTIIGDGLGKRLSDVGFKGTQENIELLERYGLALHSIERDAQNKPVFDAHITPEARQRYINDIQRTRPDIVDAEKVLQEFRHEFMQAWMVDTGYWTQDFLDKLEAINPHYLPTFRVGSSIDSKKGLTGNSAKSYTAMEAKGGTSDVYSPFYSFVGMVDQIVSMNNQNRIGQTFDRLYQENEGLGAWARPVPKSASEATVLKSQLEQVLEGNVDEDIMEQVLSIIDGRDSLQGGRDSGLLTVQRADGTTVQYQFSDAELFKLLTGAQDSSNLKVLDAVGKLTRTMSMLTTGSNPLFATRNAVRDFQTSVNYGTWASNYLTGAVKWAKAFNEVRKGTSEAFKSYKALGGGGWTRIDQNNRKSMREIQTKIFGEDKSSFGKTAKWAGKKLWDFVTQDRLNEIIEQTSRFAEYRYGQHDISTVEGRQEAFLAAQDVTVDFTRTGNSALANTMKKLVPFFNASTQGVYRTGRQFTEGERGRAGTRFAKTIINTALASALASSLILKFGDDDDKEEFTNLLSDQLKSNHLILPNPLADKEGKNGQPPFIRLPLAQDPVGYAVHAAVTNAIWRGTTDELAIALSAVTDTILDNLNPLGSGTILQPLIDVSHNRTWFDTAIVRSAQEGWTDPTGQYNEDTPTAFRWLGNLMNTSPEIVEYLATQYTGFLGAVGIPALTFDKAGNIGGFDAVMKEIAKKWTADPLTSNNVTSQFYDMVSDLDTIQGEAKQNRPQGLLLRSLSQDDTNAAYEQAAEMMSSTGLVGRTRQAISDAYAQMDEINANDTLTDAQKYELTSPIKKEMLETVMAANDELKAYRKKYIEGESLIDRFFSNLHKRAEFGAIAHVKDAVEKLPDTFLQDAGSEDQEAAPYMSKILEVYEAKGKNKSTALPHPSESFSIKNDWGVTSEYTIPEDEKDHYDAVYRDAYAEKLEALEMDGPWESLTLEEKSGRLTKAHTAANKAMKKAFEEEHRDDIMRDTTGQYGRGNIDLNNRIPVENEDGSISTEYSFSTEIDGKEVLLPTIINGQRVSEDEAIDHYLETGEHLGIFDTPEDAEDYAEKLHNRQDWYYNTYKPGM